MKTRVRWRRRRGRTVHEVRKKKKLPAHLFVSWQTVKDDEWRKIVTAELAPFVATESGWWSAG